MKKISRLAYLEELKGLVNTPDIKIITGVRRAGKSMLLTDFMESIKESDLNANVIYINFQDLDFSPLQHYKRLNDYVLKHYEPGKNNYLFIDEVQMCKKFELAINSIHSKEMFDIYLTGSNAFLLSSDLATLFTGRTITIEVFPFSLKEYIEYSQEPKEIAFENYLKYGGMAGAFPYLGDKRKYDYLGDVFNTVIMRDLVTRYRIKDLGMIENLSSFLMDNIANLTSPNKISVILTNNKVKTNHLTIGNYIKYLCESFIFYKAKRYDLKGKKYLATSEKYYLCDHALRYARMGVRNIDYGRIYENIVFIELLRRGYEVYIGKLYEKEIDFVAIKRDEKIYIQVSSYLDQESTLQREIGPLLAIKDSFPKMLIARTHHNEYSYEGIRIIDIVDWLSQ